MKQWTIYLFSTTVLSVTTLNVYGQTNITGRYEGKEPYCRMSIKIKRNHTIKIYRKCEANKARKEKAKWKTQNDTIIVTGWFDSEPQKWILRNECLYELNNGSETLVACKD